MLSKEMKEKVTALFTAAYGKDDKMIKYCVGKTLSAFDLRGNTVVIDKCSVQTRFCFGYSDSRYDTEDFDRANNMAAYASRSQIYFLRENHKEAGYADRLCKLNDSRWKFYAYRHYSGEYGISYCRAWEEIPTAYECFELTDAEKSIYRAELVKAAKEHHKKLAAYLKRYGMSKVETWSYWRDE